MKPSDRSLDSAADVLRRYAAVDAKLLAHDGALRTIWEQLQALLRPGRADPHERRIGFHVRDEALRAPAP